MKNGHQWQVVAVTVVITATDIGAAGLNTTVFLVFLSEEGDVVNVAIDGALVQRPADEDMVETAPAALVFVGASGAMGARGGGGDVGKAMLCEHHQGTVGGVVVEVACHNDECFSVAASDGVDGLGDALGYFQPIGAGGSFAVHPTGGVHH